MLTRIMIIALFLAAACTPNPVRSSTPPQATHENTAAESKEPSEVASIPSPMIPEETNTSSEVTPLPSPIVEDGLQKKLTQNAIEDLATQLNVDTKEVQVTSAEPIEWPNAALGCPSPDKAYAQGKVHGFRILLKVNGQVYDYHTDRAGKIVLCLEPEVKPKEPGLR